MPFITVKLIEGVFTASQKQQMIRKITDAMVSIEGENLRPVTWVIVEEVKSGDWGIGGNGVTVADVRRLAAGDDRLDLPHPQPPQSAGRDGRMSVMLD